MRITPKLGATAAAVVLFISLSGCASAAPSTPSPTSSTSPTQTAVTLGPLGYGALVLGATKAEAKATGLVDNISASATGGCGADSDGWLLGAPKPTGEVTAGRLFFDTETGKLVAINAYGEVATPAGIKLGSTITELKAAYKDWSSVEGEEETNTGRGYADVPGNKDATYRIVVADEKVVELTLQSDNQGCYE